MSIRNRLILFAMAIALCILALVGFWVREHRQHATPETALNHDQHVGGIVAKVPFAKGVVVIAFVQGDSLGAYYMKNGFWGWKNYGGSGAALSLSTQNYNVDFEPFSVDGETFAWGTLMVPMREIIDRHMGKTYTWHSAGTGQSLVWHIILPYEQSLFYHSDWSMVLNNGKTAPLFK